MKKKAGQKIKKVLVFVSLIMFVFLGLIIKAEQNKEISGGSKGNILSNAAEQWFKAHPTGRIYIQCDKPLYQPGETIWFKSTIFESRSLKSVEEASGYSCELLDSRGTVLVSKMVQAKSGAGENDIVIPNGVVGGEYKLKIKYYGGPEETRTVMVNAYKPPLIQKKLDIIGKAYGPGDKVTAKASFKRGTGESLVNHEVVGIVTIDGAETKRLDLKTDDKGELQIQFDLPEIIKTEDGYISLQVTEGGLTEGITRSIPLLLSSLNIDFYPEGGDLIDGISSRVYFQALKYNGKPAKVAGIIVDSKDKEIVSIQSYHNGMGRFEFTPLKNEKYFLKVSQPSSVKDKYPLPDPKAEGMVMKVKDNDWGKSEEVHLTIFTKKTYSNVTIIAALRESVAAVQTIDLIAGENKVILRPEAGQGVMRLTVLDNNFIPQCERLVYHRMGNNMQVKITPDKSSYMPREKVTLTIETSLPNGKPCAGELALSVVDDRVLSFADDKTANLLTQIYLLKDLPGEVEEPNFYFDPKEEKAHKALDLLLGSRGWRKFQWVYVTDPAKHKDVRVTDQLIYEVMKNAPRSFYDDEVLDFFTEEGLEKNFAVDKKIKGKNEIKKIVKPAKIMKVVAKEPEEIIMLEAVAGKELAFKEKRLRGWIEEDKKDRSYSPWAVVREFPEVKYKTTETNERNDFRETIIWKPRITTDILGIAKVSFYLNDSITSFRATAEGNALSGFPGRSEKVFNSKTPMHVEAKLPVVVSSGDILNLPIRITNETENKITVTGSLALPDFLKAVDPALLEQTLSGIEIDGKEAKTIFCLLEVSQAKGEGVLSLSFNSKGLNDNVKEVIKVEPVGFPVQESVSGTVGTNESFEINIPKQIVGNSLEAELSFYPSPLATIMSGLESILREPCGCFEQASSSTYPNIMVLQYLRQKGVVSPEIEERAMKLIEKGYEKLGGYECKEKGYEWFGGDPGHEALTAYGLMEFNDMSKIYDKVDPEMVKRTAKWLMAQRDGEGGFKRNARALDTFGRASAEVTNAYIVWALNESGNQEIEKERESIVKTALKSEDPYVIALSILGMQNKDSEDRNTLVEKLLSTRKNDGHFEGKDRSITGSTGQFLNVESTALSIMALLRTGKEASSLNQSVEWLMKSRQGGGFGPTQSTILTLKALIAYAEASRTTKHDGDIAIRINGTLAERRHFNKGEQGVISIKQLEDHLKEGKNRIDIELISQQTLPYGFNINYKTITPNSSKDCPLELTAGLKKSLLRMGEMTTLDVTLKNISKKGVGMVLARIGIPAGLVPQMWQLKEMRENRLIDFYETTPREVILYFRDMAPEQDRDFSIALQADIPGEFTGIASSAYLYYNNIQKFWVEPSKVKITKTE